MASRNCLRWVPHFRARPGRLPLVLAVAFAFLVGLGVHGGSSARAQGSAPIWPTFHHDNARTGLSPFNTAANNGTLLWEYKPGNPTDGSSVVWSSPVIGADGTVYFGGNALSGGNNPNLYALNPDGTLKWRFPLPSGIDSNPALGPDGTIYTTSSQGDYNLYAINPNGTLRWKHFLNNSIATGDIAVGPDGTVYVNAGPLQAVNPDGTAKWQFPPSGAVGGISGSPSIAPDGTIYIGYRSSGIYYVDYLEALNPDGSAKWATPSGGALLGTVAVGKDGTLYGGFTGSGGAQVVAFSATGTKLWSFSTGASNMGSPAIGPDGTIYDYSQDGNLYALNPDGSLKWAFRTTSGPAGSNSPKSSPAIGADGTIYFGDLNGQVVALNPDGSLHWSYPAGCTAVLSSPAIGADGTIYVGDGDPAYVTCGDLLALGSGGPHSLSSTTPTYISPSYGGNTGKVTVTAVGSGFAPGATATLSGGPTPIPGADVSVSLDGHLLKATFDLTGQPPGPRDFVVTNPRGGTMTIPGGFTVQSGGAANVQFNLFGPYYLRAGEGRTYYASATNTGSVNAPGLVGLIKIPSAIQVQSTLPVLTDADGTQTLIVTCSDTELGPSQVCTVPFRLNVPDTSTFAHHDFVLDWSSFVTGVPATASDPTTRIQTISFSSSSGAFHATQHLSSATTAGDVSLSVSPTGAPGLAVPQVTITDSNGTTAITYADDSSAGGVKGTLELADNIKDKYDTAQSIWQDEQAFKNHEATREQIKFLCDNHLLSNLDCQTENNLNDANLPLQVASNHIPDAASPLWKASGGDALTGVMNGAVDKRLWVQMQLGQEEALANYLSPFCKVEFSGCTDAHQLTESELIDLINRVRAVQQTRQGSLQIQSIVSGDPNDLSGTPGVGPERWVSGNQLLAYQVFFSNEPTASAPAQNVTITDQLDPARVDLSTASLGPISFGQHVVTPPPGATQYSAVVDLRPAQTLAVHIDAQINRSTGLITWSYKSIDPTTGQPPTDPTVGFLPADTSPPNGEGDVVFDVTPRAGLPTGTQITNQATVTFDVNAPISTGVWTNTIDTTPPSSHVAPLPAKESSTSFPVQWLGTDSGSGVMAYSVWVSDNGGPFTLWQKDTPNTSAIYAGVNGHSYAFYSIAADNVGNVEPAKTTAEASTTVTLVIDTTPPVITATVTGTLGDNGWYTSNVTVTWSVIDPESPISSSTGCETSTITADTAGTTLTCTATSAGGTASQTVTIKRDATPPTATAAPSPTPNANGWNNTDVSVSLAATDPAPGGAASGVKEVHYVVDGGPNVVTPGAAATIPLSAEGIHTISYYAVDNAGNRQAPGTLTVKIDKTPPEAYDRFDPVLRDVLVFGRDALSGTASAAIPPTSVSKVAWGKGNADGGNNQGKDQGSGTKDGDQGKADETGNAELRTYRIVDAAGNTLVLVEKVKREGKEVQAEIVSLQYNGGAMVTPPKNQQSFEWATNEDGSLKALKQKLETGRDKDKRQAEATYDAKKDQTTITVNAGGKDKDTHVVKPGLVLLRLATSGGGLLIEY